jgi:hypothetical protein
MDHDAPEREPLLSLPSVAILTAGLVVCGSVSVALGQDTNWDLRNYHIYSGYALLTGRWGRDVAPAQIQSFLNPVLHAATYFLLSNVPPRVFGFLMGAVQGLNFWLIFLISRAVLIGLGPRIRFGLSLLCAVAGATGVVGLSQLGSTTHDLTTAAIVLVAVLVYVRARVKQLQSPRTLGTQLLICGALLGVGVGLKYTLALYAIGFAAGILADGPELRERARRVLIWGVGALAGFAVSAGHWMYRLYTAYGNPLFPYYNALFKSPYVGPENIVDDRWVPLTLTDALQYPFLFNVDNAIASEVRFTDLRFALVFLLVTVVVIAWLLELVSGRAANPPSSLDMNGGRWLLVFFFVSYFVWLKQFAVYRYVASLEMLAPLLMCCLLGKLTSDRRRLASVAAFEFVIGAATLSVPDWGRAPWSKRYIEIAKPRIVRPAKSVVVMASTEPIGYAVAGFPPEARFVRIESNFFNPLVDTRLAKDVAEILRASDVDYYLLTTMNAVAQAPDLLTAYALSVVDCAALKANLEDNLVFCRLKRQPTIDGEKTPRPAGAPAAGAPSAQARLSATPNPVRICDRVPVAGTQLSWEATGVSSVEIRAGSPAGRLVVRGGANGTVETGASVTRGSTFYLQNGTPGAPASEDSTLAKLTIDAVSGSCP